MNPRLKHYGSPQIRLMEECSELIKAICKAERFGYMPTEYEGVKYNNLDDIKKEMADVNDAIEALAVHFRKLQLD